MCMYHISFTHSLADRHSSSLYFVDTLNSDSVMMRVQMSLWQMVVNSQGCMNHVGIQCQFCILLCFIVVDVIVALETSLLLSKMAMLIYISTNSGPEFHFLHILTNICWRFFFVFCFLISIQTYWNEVISPWALIYISLRISEIELFVLGTYWPLYFPLEKKSPFKATAHFLIRFFFYYWVLIQNTKLMYKNWHHYYMSIVHYLKQKEIKKVMSFPKTIKDKILGSKFKQIGTGSAMKTVNHWWI